MDFTLTNEQEYVFQLGIIDIHSVHWGIPPPHLKNTISLFLAKPPPPHP